MWNGFVELFVDGLRALYNLTGNLGWAIILFTIVARALLFPLTLKTLRSQKKLQALQPQLREIQRKYGRDREKAAQEQMKLYKEAGVSPVGGCLPTLLQLPIFFAVYGAVIKIVQEPGVTNSFFWIPDLSKHDPIFVLPVLSIVLQFVVQLMATPRVQDEQQKAMSRAMLFMPVFFGYFAFTFASGAVLYWVMGTVIAIVQQYFTTGWGSLVNFLPFLPADKGYLTRTPAQQEQGGAVEYTAQADSVAINKPAGFWDVLEKLAPKDEPAGESAAAAVTANGSSNDEERAISEVRAQSKRRRR